MHTIKVRNVNQALMHGLQHLLNLGKGEPSRNGNVIVAPSAVATVYEKPTERVLFSKVRNANPFFHLMEALWMLAGRNDIAFPAYFNSRFFEYSDDGVIQHGAYGYRWRYQFGFDQIAHLVEELKTNPNSRRAVLQMWSAPIDLIQDEQGRGGLKSKDVPCNTHAYFDLRNGALNMTVCNRSNDVIWGAYGANAVHFSILQEYMAAWIGVPVGVYTQVSNNFHVYTDLFDCDALRRLALDAAGSQHYLPAPNFPDLVKVKPYPLVSVDIELWNSDLKEFMTNPPTRAGRVYNDPFFTHVAQPMAMAFWERKEIQQDGKQHIELIHAEDWKLACQQYVEVREEKSGK